MNDKSRLVECTIPILPVRDLVRSIRFYVDRLGFSVDWGKEPNSRICSVSRDHCSVMLVQQESTVSPAWVWIGLENDSLFDAYRSNGVTVFQEPQNHPWAYEMKFQDPDGNILWLGTEPKSDVPFQSSTG